MNLWLTIAATAVVCCGTLYAQQYSQQNYQAPVYQAPPQYQAPQYQQKSYQQANYSAPQNYGNYSKPQYGGYAKQYNGTARYLQNSSYATVYGNNIPWAYIWDHEDKIRHSYDQEAYDWIFANWLPGWEWAYNTWEAQNNVYNGYGQSCGYTGNPYNDYDTRYVKQADILVLMAQWLWDNYPGYDKQKLIPAMINLDVSKFNHPFFQECLAEHYTRWQGTCNQYTVYSRPDQICNNIAYPTWGAWGDIGIRITHIWNYEGGIWRQQKYNIWPDYNGQITPLYDAKLLANELDKQEYGQCYNLDTTMLHAYWTQFAAHDIIKSVPYRVTGYHGKQVKPECCLTPDNCLHHTCKPYKALYNNGYNQYPICEGYSDNIPAIDYCTPLPKDPTNDQTAYIDASAVYGATCYDAERLRSHRKGKLRINQGKYGIAYKNILLPDDDYPETDECDTSYPDQDLKCHLSGDKRGNQHGGIYLIQTLFFRLHNRLATSCAKYLERYYLSPEVVDEICYQETRRIVIGIVQIIFYRDHLPVELGPYVAKDPNYGLGLDYVLPYDPAVHASAWPEYVYAAGRLHSTCSHWNQVDDPAKVAAGLTAPDSWYGIYDFFHKAYALLWSKENLNTIASNALYDPEQCFDTSFVAELRNPNPIYGSHTPDMYYLNQHRGREFGAPWYTQVRDWCGIGYVNDWADLQGVWSETCLNTLPGLVYHPKNVELYIGINCEKPLPGAVVGPTAACILQRQYYNLREGDRWFVDRNGWNYAQLEVLKKFDIGIVLCITTNLDYVTKNPFRTPNPYGNPYVACNAYDTITEDDLAVLWSTIPYVPGDYRTCKEYGAYGGGYQNATYGGGYANNTNYGNQQYQPAYQQQQVNYQATQNYQSQGYPSPKYGVEQSAYQQAPKYSAQYG